MYDHIRLATNIHMLTIRRGVHVKRILLQLYYAHAYPHLTYGITVWGSYNPGAKHHAEKQQSLLAKQHFQLATMPAIWSLVELKVLINHVIVYYLLWKFACGLSLVSSNCSANFLLHLVAYLILVAIISSPREHLVPPSSPLFSYLYRKFCKDRSMTESWKVRTEVAGAGMLVIIISMRDQVGGVTLQLYLVGEVVVV
eukprot:g46012.t1